MRRTLLAAAAAFLRRDSREGRKGLSGSRPLRTEDALRPRRAGAPVGGVGQPRAGLQARITPKGAPARGSPACPSPPPDQGGAAGGRGLRGFKAGGAGAGTPTARKLKDCEGKLNAAAPSGQVGPHSHAWGLSPRPAGLGWGRDELG